MKSKHPKKRICKSSEQHFFELLFYLKVYLHLIVLVYQVFFQYYFSKAAFSQLEQENEKLRQKLEEARLQSLEREEEDTRQKEEEQIKKSEEKMSRKQFEDRLKSDTNLVSFLNFQ